MLRLHELKNKRAQKVASIKALINKEAELPDDQTLPQEDLDTITQLQGEIAALDERIGRAESLLNIEGDNADPLDPDNEPETMAGDPDDPLASQERSYGPRVTRGAYRLEPAVRQKEPKGFKAARFILGQLKAKTCGMREASAWVEKRFRDKEVAKALNTTGTAAGGALIPQAFATEIIELLRARTVVRDSDPTTIPMPGGNLTIPRLAAGASAGYNGELDDIGASQESFDDLQLNAKKLTALVPVSNDLIRRSPIGVEELVRDDLLQTMARREDLAFLTGDGMGNSPIGMLNQAAAANKIIATALPAATGDSSTDNQAILTAVVSVLQGMLLLLENGMSMMVRPTWITTPSVKMYLMTLRDGVGNFVFRDELSGDDPHLMGHPLKISQQLPSNLNTGTTAAPVNNGAYIFMADMKDVVIADTYEIFIDASDVAVYQDTSGAQVSAFRRDQTVFRVISEHDFGLRHQASLAVATVPGWAPTGYTPNGGAAYYVQAPSGTGSAAASTWGTPPTGSNNPGNGSAVAPGGTEAGIA